MDNYHQLTSFITNEENNTLLNRFGKILAKTNVFDSLVGYFYVSGFHRIEKSLDNSQKIRILVGMGIDNQTFKLIFNNQTTLISSAQVKEKVNKKIIEEMDHSEDSYNVEVGAKKFIEWLKSGKLEVRAYKKRKTHSKIYIMTYPEEDIDPGRVITGSSNLTEPGLEKNLEFNVELSRPEDYYYAHEKFEEMWEDSTDVTEEYINTLTKHTWLNDTITPYELYLKFIYEFLYEKIDNDRKDISDFVPPEGFKYLDYQKDAVLEAKEIIKEHGGVFLSDVVGLGKTYMGALLAQQLKGRTLVIAPPSLIDKHTPGGWYRVLQDFEVKAVIESKGKLDQILNKYERNYYQNVIIDESHAFRNEETQQYEDLSEICKDKNVILISATPFNNSPSDLLSQIKLFQNAHKSTLPNPKVRNIEGYFNHLDAWQKSINNTDNPEEYLKVSKEISADIRENVLKYLMVRRTRNSIAKYYKKDLKKHNMEFPDVKSPIPIYYQFDEKTNEIFERTLYKINKDLTYAKYRPLSEEYMVNPKNQHSSAQKNMANFIKILLIKRLESGSAAFTNSIDNSVKIHEQVIKTFENDKMFITSRDYNRKVFSLIEEDDVNKIEDLIKEGKAKKYKSGEFKPQFINDLKTDLKVLQDIQKDWQNITNYPKKKSIINLLNKELKNKKVILFTEFIDTADELKNLILENVTSRVIEFTGNSSSTERDEVLYNFDANIPKNGQKDDYDILITTDVLAHGVNLHCSNIIINFDIPWNPTRMMQRVGRVQRLDTKFDEIYIYNFFPTAPIEKNINVEALAKKKIGMFIELLGNDSQLLTEEPIVDHDDLFNKLTSDITDEEEFVDDELRYLSLLRHIRDEDIKLYKKIENIPKKARVARKSTKNTSLITLMKSNKFKKVFKSNQDKTEEIDFFDAIKELKAEPDEKGIKFNEEYYEYLHNNLKAFESLINQPEDMIKLSRNEIKIQNYVQIALKYRDDLASYDINYLNKLNELIELGQLSKNQTKKLSKELKDKIESEDAFSIIDICRNYVHIDCLNLSQVDTEETNQNLKEIVLSEYFH